MTVLSRLRAYRRMQTLRIAAEHDWLPYEAIIEAPIAIRMIAWRAGLMSGRFSRDQVRAAEGISPRSTA